MDQGDLTIKIKLELNGADEWHWYYGVVTYGHSGNGINWRRGNDKPFDSREAALENAREYAGYIQKLADANKIIKTEELEL